MAYDDIHVSPTFDKTSPAYEYVKCLDNRSGTIRAILEDLVNAHKDIQGNYTSYPQKTRLEKYFGVKRPNGEVKQEMLNSLKNMKEKENKRIVYEVQYIRFFQEYEYTLTNDGRIKRYFVLLVIQFAKKLAANGGPKKNMMQSFFDDFFKFQKECISKNCDEKWKLALEGKEASIEVAEKMFALLADQWFSITAADSRSDKYNAQQVADIVLEFMELNPECSYIDNGFTMSLFSRFVREKLNAVKAPVPSAS